MSFRNNPQFEHIYEHMYEHIYEHLTWAMFFFYLLSVVK